MNSFGYRVNQWKIGSRVGLLCVILLTIWMSWYVLLYQPLMMKSKRMITQHAKLQTMSRELTLLKASSKNFIYQNDIKSIQLQQIIQQAISQVPGLSIKSVVNAAQIVLSSAVQQFNLMPALFNVSLQSSIQQAPVTVVYSGDFDSFREYLKILQNTHAPLYFESVDFKMNHYPVATITMKVFTLEV